MRRATALTALCLRFPLRTKSRVELGASGVQPFEHRPGQPLTRAPEGVGEAHPPDEGDRGCEDRRAERSRGRRVQRTSEAAIVSQ